MASVDSLPPVEPYPPALVQFVFSPDTFQKADFPRDLYAREVKAFVFARINPTVAPAALEQLFFVVDHYDVHEVAPFLLAMAEPRKDATPATAGRSPEKRPPAVSLPARITIIKTVAVAGLAEERARAAGLYRAICLEVPVENLPVLQSLVETYETAALDLDAAPLAERLGSAARAFAKFETSLAPGDAERRQQFGELDGLHRRLQRAVKTTASKRAILGIAERPRRVRTLVRAYLDLPTDYTGYLIDWSARRLRRETWAPQLAEQTERQFCYDLRTELAEAFRSALRDIDAGGEPDEVKVKQRVAALDAVQFFNSPLTEDESKFLVSAGEGYVMPLSLRQIWPAP
jgi:hypothetical protein